MFQCNVREVFLTLVLKSSFTDNQNAEVPGHFSRPDKCISFMLLVGEIWPCLPWRKLCIAARVAETIRCRFVYWMKCKSLYGGLDGVMKSV